MLRPRLIPCLLIKNNGLVKTVNFDSPKYVGDPINAVKIFNEKEVDELIVLDIDASALNREPNYNLIKELAEECRMPLCYGGGVKTVEQAERILNLGVEKVAFSAAAIADPTLIKRVSERVGSQSVVVVVDIKCTGLWKKNYSLTTHNAGKEVDVDPFVFVKQIEELGAGELVINSVDRDGAMSGYDLPLIEKFREILEIPMTVLGGAGSLDDIRKVIDKVGVIGIAVGSLFVFKGRYRAVLINYPGLLEKNKLLTCDT
ncbi:MAG: AglZ/HisF2 family acetamidino modification protein [Legionellaceae bacterium]|nr:AglZ/HisF2 family acetamidino modification protein [Legionellaceae bacterium]